MKQDELLKRTSREIEQSYDEHELFYGGGKQDEDKFCTPQEAKDLHTDYQQMLSEDIEFRPKLMKAFEVIQDKQLWIDRLLKTIAKLEDENETLKSKVDTLKIQRENLLIHLQDYLELEKEKG